MTEEEIRQLSFEEALLKLENIVREPTKIHVININTIKLTHTADLLKAFVLLVWTFSSVTSESL